MAEQTPISITISRETGKIVDVERGEVREEDFKRIMGALSDYMKEILRCG